MCAALTTLLLSGCGPSVKLDSQPVVELRGALAEPPGKLAAPCDGPVSLPDTISAGAVERLWARDRGALGLCRDRHADLLDFYRRRDAGLAGLQ